MREQVIAHQQAPLSASLTSLHGIASRWRRIELALDRPTEDGDTTRWLWSNPPETVTAGRIAELYGTRWHIEGMFGRLESVLHIELRRLGHPRAALLGFAAAVLAYNVLVLLQRAVEQAHQPPPALPSRHAAATYLAAAGGVLLPPSCAGQGRLRGPAHRLAARTLAALAHRVVLDEPGVEAKARRLLARCTELRSYIETNEGALIDYGQRSRAVKPISTSRAEGTVNQLVNARMNKRRQMCWSPRGAQRVLQVRAALLEGRFGHQAIQLAA